VEMAVRLTMDEAGVDVTTNVAGDPIKLASGSARFLELDAEELGQHFPEPGFFDCVWISEAMSHLPEKRLFFQNAARLLTTNGKLVIADWFKAENLTIEQFEADIKPIEGTFQHFSLKSPPQLADPARRDASSSSLHPNSVHTTRERSRSPDIFRKSGYQLRCRQDLRVVSAILIEKRDISWSLIQSPALWAFAFSQGRDGIAFLQAFRAMRRGYANGAFRYAVMVFQKPVKD
ncbi:MAG: hypothetical protein Q9177_006874, partial [Variospora cf. flavescens]